MSLCEKIPVIPQNLSTCWFNAILMAMIYSDELSRVVYKKAIEDNWHLDKNGAFKTLMLLFMNYVRAIKKNNIKLIDRLKYFLIKYKTEILLLDYLTHYDKNLLLKGKETILKSGNIFYLIMILKNLNLTFSLIIFGDGNIYCDVQHNYDKDEFEKPSINHQTVIPDVLVCADYNQQKLDLLGYTSENIENFGKEIIVFRGHSYKLDNILLSDDKLTHIILGLTCNNSKYVYNGWWKEKREYPCNLIPFDWQNHFNDFCLDTDNCQLPNQDTSKANDICFNFKDNFKILIYVKDEEKQMDEKKHIRKINKIDNEEVGDFLSSELLLSSVYSKDINLSKSNSSLKGLGKRNKDYNIDKINIGDLTKLKKLELINLLKSKFEIPYSAINKKTKLELIRLINERYLLSLIQTKSIYITDKIINEMYLSDEIFQQISQLAGYNITNKEDLLNFFKQKKPKIYENELIKKFSELNMI